MTGAYDGKVSFRKLAETAYEMVKAALPDSDVYAVEEPCGTFSFMVYGMGLRPIAYRWLMDGKIVEYIAPDLALLVAQERGFFAHRGSA